MKSWILTLGFPLVLMAGCFSAASRLEQQDVTPQSYEEKSQVPVLVSPIPIATAENPVVQSSVVPPPAVPASKVAAQIVTPPPITGPVVAYATYSRIFKGQGIHYFNDVHAFRFMSPFGMGAGETISDAAKKPATISAGDTPTISMGPDGSFKVGKGEDAKVVGTETGGSILSQIVTKVKDWGLIILIAIGAIIVLPLVFPILGPIFSHLWAVVTGMWAWIKSIFASLAAKTQAALPVVKADAAALTAKVTSEWRTLTTAVSPAGGMTTASATTPTATMTGAPTSVSPASVVPSGNSVVDPTLPTKSLDAKP